MKAFGGCVAASPHQRAAPEKRAERKEHPRQERRAEVEQTEEGHVHVLVAAALARGGVAGRGRA